MPTVSHDTVFEYNTEDEYSWINLTFNTKGVKRIGKIWSETLKQGTNTEIQKSTTAKQICQAGRELIAKSNL